MSVITLSQLWFYPVKSLRGIPLRQALLDSRGIRHDRHWMVVDPRGRFITQREERRLALVDQRIEGHCLQLAAPGMEPLELHIDPVVGEPLAVEVWGDRLTARTVGEAADGWFSDLLGRECRLVWMPPECERPVDPTYAEPRDRTGFADGFPLLLISEGSLGDLNGRLERPLPMERFRPNLVVNGCEPYAEDRWRRIRICGVTMRVVKPCSRCIITTINPATAERSEEPLRTLSEYRRVGNKVFFGQNLLHDAPGLLECGMEVEILE